MRIVAEFDPSTTQNDSFTVPQSSANGKIVVWNESNISLKFSVQTGDTAYIPAWTARLFCGVMGGPGNDTISWVQHTQLIQNNPPISQVIVEAYAQGEPVPGTFPMALAARGTNIGNSIPVATAATDVQNLGNVAGTNVALAQVAGDSGNSVNLTNDGKLILGDAAYPGEFSMPQGVNIAQSASGDTLTTSGANTFLKARTGHVYLESVSGQHDLDVSNSQITANGNLNVTAALSVSGPGSIAGLDISSGNLQFPDGSHVSEIHSFSGNGSGTFAHNCSAKPDTIMLTCANPGGGSQTMGYDPTTLTSTHITVTAGAGLPWVGLAIVH